MTERSVDIETPTTENHVITEKTLEQLDNTPNDRTNLNEESVIFPGEEAVRQAKGIIETDESADENQDENSLVVDEMDKAIETDQISDLFEVKDEIIGNDGLTKSSEPGAELDAGKPTREKDSVEEAKYVETPQTSLKPKIKLYKGYSGELIENTQIKSGKKRKKRDKPAHSRKAKVAKLSKKDTKEQHEMLDTLQRINYELPGHNWLEQKIKNNEADPSQGNSEQKK